MTERPERPERQSEPVRGSDESATPTEHLVMDLLIAATFSASREATDG